MSILIPPIKSQGIKTKLVPWINDLVRRSGVDLSNANWIEPFFGTGVVGLNTPVQGKRIVGDSNPHIIKFYNSLLDGSITPQNMREFLQIEGWLLKQADEAGYAHYKKVRERFNHEFSPFDFIFLSRAGFNGMMRFNRKGEWNIPFCKKQNRFASAYITKICNQIAQTQVALRRYDWEFSNVSFIDTISKAKKGDVIYCDPPYLGRYVDYYNGWTEEDEELLFRALKATPAYFILSTWHHNEFRRNDMVRKYWDEFNVETKEHFYHGGAHIENRHSIIEALVFNFEPNTLVEHKEKGREQQLMLEFSYSS